MGIFVVDIIGFVVIMFFGLGKEGTPGRRDFASLKGGGVAGGETVFYKPDEVGCAEADL